MYVKFLLAIYLQILCILDKCGQMQKYPANFSLWYVGDHLKRL